MEKLLTLDDPELERKHARVIYTRSLVSIYVDGKKVAVHLRTERFGYTIVREHMASNSQAVTSRSAQYYIDKAARTSQNFCLLLKSIFDRSGILPETQYKRCDWLFHLLHSSPIDDFNYAYRMEGHEMHFFDKLIKCDLLILDDFGMKKV
jgi:hypothetical protein